MKTSDKLKAAQEAFAAYERALQAAQDVVDDGPPTGLGTTLMIEVDRTEWSNKFACCECKKCVLHQGIPTWKFCPHCGAEIIRWKQRMEPKTITLPVEEVNGKQTASKTPNHFWP